MKRTGCKAAMIALAVLVVAGLVFASGRPGRAVRSRLRLGEPRVRFAMRHRVPGRPMMLGLILHTLELTDEQKELIREIIAVAKVDMEAAREAVAEASDALQDAVMQGADEGTIRAAASALGDVIGDQAVLKAQTIASIKAILTDEQLAQLEEKLAGLAELEDILE